MTNGTNVLELGPEAASRRIAYFSMEVGLDSRMPTYAGGLGVLAGDTLRSCADLQIPIIGVSLLYGKGYFDQRLDPQGWQEERPVVWNPADFVKPLPARTSLRLYDRPLMLRAWQYEIRGSTGHLVPVLLLDSDVDDNDPADRDLTSFLYGGDERYRLAQEMILGVGGVRMLRALGYTGLERFHMNEGHASLLALELLREEAAVHPSLDEALAHVRQRCIFTTHTPIEAAQDRFSYELVGEHLVEEAPLAVIRALAGEDRLNMTRLALNLSHHVNGVAKSHGRVSNELFPGYSIDAITNGVHTFTWASDSFRDLYDRRIPGWANDPFSLRYAISIPNEEIWAAHARAKARLVAEVNRRTGRGFAEDAFTLGFARRATAYKRTALVLSDPQALRDIAAETGPLQMAFAGKAHPKDQPGKDLIRQVFQASGRLGKDVKVVYLDNYDMDLARLMTSGVDLWLNTPLPPLEASGTSGMKAALNGVPSLSVLDGWWIEGHVEGVTGWSIGPHPKERPDSQGPPEGEAADLYQKLRTVIGPLFYTNRKGWTDVMRFAIAFNASFFNAHRMVEQYAASAYL